MTHLIYQEKYKYDERPLVEIIAEQLGARLYTYEDWGGKQYCINDWVQMISGRSKSWNADIRHIMNSEHAIEGHLYISQHPIPIGIKGKTRMEDFCDDEGLYYIVQHMPSSSTVMAVKQFLAKAGVLVDTIRREPDKAVDIAREAYRMQGKSEEWIDTRLEGKVKRRDFTDALTRAIGEGFKNEYYGFATGNIYRGLWKRTAQNLKEQLGLSPKSPKLRDNQPRLGLMYQSIAEEVCTVRLENDSAGVVSWKVADEIIQEVAKMIGKQARETGRLLDRDLATGKLLSQNPKINRLYEK